MGAHASGLQCFSVEPALREARGKGNMRSASFDEFTGAPSTPFALTCMPITAGCMHGPQWTVVSPGPPTPHVAGGNPFFAVAPGGGSSFYQANVKLLSSVHRQDVTGVAEALLEGAVADVRRTDMDPTTMRIGHAARSGHGMTPLMLACRDGQQDLAELLLQNKAQVNATDHRGWTPLFAASTNGNLDCCLLLLKYDADINRPDRQGRTALDCTPTDHQEAVRELFALEGPMDPQ
mmetsp:Transcript_105702/g.242064  ORF Transcript_105702/g.242064 Transcript_105702/m.242064 type:complete len:235 (-) Transcript_105702:52-756(-)